MKSPKRLPDQVTILRARRRKAPLAEPLVVDGRTFTQEEIVEYLPCHRKLAATITANLVTLAAIRDVSTEDKVQLAGGEVRPIVALHLAEGSRWLGIELGPAEG